jgi:hypothetical protein
LKNKSLFKNAGLFILVVAIDIILIQLFRHFTPLIVPLRLSFVFVVIAVSIMLYYIIIKPERSVFAGLILSIICFAVALCESYIIHVVVEHGKYRLLFLLPSCFALVLPFFLSIVYAKFFSNK